MKKQEISHHKKAGELLDQVRDVMRLRYNSVRTERAYIGWIKRFILFHDKRYPKEVGELEAQLFLTRPGGGDVGN